MCMSICAVICLRAWVCVYASGFALCGQLYVSICIELFVSVSFPQAICPLPYPNNAECQPTIISLVLGLTRPGFEYYGGRWTLNSFSRPLAESQQRLTNEHLPY